MNPPGYSSIGVANSPEWRQAQFPSTNIHGTATGVARLYRALLEPRRVSSPTLLTEATSAQSVAFCPVLGEDATTGLGSKPTNPRRPFGLNPSVFSHFGTGEAVGFADAGAGVDFGYAMNHVIPRSQSRRNRSLVAGRWSTPSTAACEPQARHQAVHHKIRAGRVKPIRTSGSMLRGRGLTMWIVQATDLNIGCRLERKTLAGARQALQCFSRN